VEAELTVGAVAPRVGTLAWHAYVRGIKRGPKDKRAFFRQYVRWRLQVESDREFRLGASRTFKAGGNRATRRAEAARKRRAA